MTDKQIKTIQSATDSESNNAIPVYRSTPAVDIYETADALVIKADMPGVAEPDLQVEIEHAVLTLEGNSLPDGKGQTTYYRQFRLSEAIDPDGADAELKNGVLTLRLPKSEAAKPKRVAVKTLH
ncbi:MAG: heat-shock protein [Desulfuromonas sp.]|jgi:HSP20 family molecular chaperone IbpA|nr:MAG: heat-shock protein [Desulfuromonas sp.]